MVNKKENRIFFSKKGQMPHKIFFKIFELVLAIMVIIALFVFINDVADQTIFERNYMARDLAILINTLYSAPGEITYNYDEDTSLFVIEIDDNKVEVYSEEEEQTSNIFYLFSEDENIPITDNILISQDSRLTFIKSEDSLDVE